MSQLKLANCPVSWGIEDVDKRNPSWQQVLLDAAQAGYAGIELGPLGFFPSDGDEFERALTDSGLELLAGYVMEPLADSERREQTLNVASATCAMLSRFGASVLVLIDDMSAERSATAGRPDAAVRATEEQWETLRATAEDVARLAVNEYGLTVAFHPHAGTLVEFADEIERFFAEINAGLIGVCVDTGHSLYAGIDPLELIERYGQRLRYLHLKDLNSVVHELVCEQSLNFEQAVEKGIFCPVGSGRLDLAALRKTLEQINYSNLAAVEQDRSPGQVGPTSPAEDARLSLRALAAAGLTSDRSLPEAHALAGEGETST